MNDLPNELLGRVFASCGREEGERLTLVCRRWHDVFYSEPALWHTLRLSPPAVLLRMLSMRERWTACKQALLRRVGGLVEDASIRAEEGRLGWALAESLLPLIQPQLAGLHLSFALPPNRTIGGLVYSSHPPGPHPPPPPQPEVERAAAAVLQALPHRFPRLQRLNLDLAARSGPALPPCTPAVLRQLALTDLWIDSPCPLPADLLESIVQVTTLTQLRLASTSPAVPLPAGLAALTTLRQMRHLELMGCKAGSGGGAAQVPLSKDFEAIYSFEVAAAEGACIEVAGATVRRAKSWLEQVDGEWQCSLELRHLQANGLEPVLAALRLPGWLPETLDLSHAHFTRDGAAAVEGCAPYLAHLGGLHLTDCGGAQHYVGQLAAQAPHLTSLKLDNCSMTALPPSVVALQGLAGLNCLYNQLTHLPPGPYLSGLEGLQLSGNRFASLPAALTSAGASLTYLGLAENPPLSASSQQMEELLDGLPALKCLDIEGDTCIDQGVMSHVQDLGRARGVRVMPQASDCEDGYGEGGGYGGGYDSSDSDSSADGCPRFSWAGCAYASHW